MPPIRVLFLASYFPRPMRPVAGVWALQQAQAFIRVGMPTLVVSYTPWVPRTLGKLGVKRQFALCPLADTREGVEIRYPRAPLYSTWFRPVFNNPRPHTDLAWSFLKSPMLKAVRDFAPDVIYAHNTIPNGIWARRVHQALGTPYVITNHDFGLVEKTKDLPRREALFADIANNAAMTCTVSRSMEEMHRGVVPNAPVRTVYNGTNPVPAEAFDTPRPAELEGKTIALCVAKFFERKNVPGLIRSFAAIAHRHPNAQLRIIGGGYDQDKVEAAVAQTGLGPDRITLLGLVAPERVKQEMVWADLFALPSWQEPFATVYLESCSAGTPMIWCTDGGINDVLRDREHGLAIPPKDEAATADALNQLLADQDLRQTMGNNARRLFDEGLSWDAHAETMKGIFHEAIGGRA